MVIATAVWAEHLLCQKSNRRAIGLYVYEAAKQTHLVLIKNTVDNIWKFNQSE